MPHKSKSKHTHTRGSHRRLLHVPGNSACACCDSAALQVGVSTPTTFSTDKVALKTQCTPSHTRKRESSAIRVYCTYSNHRHKKWHPVSKARHWLASLQLSTPMQPLTQTLKAVKPSILPHITLRPPAFTASNGQY